MLSLLVLLLMKKLKYLFPMPLTFEAYWSDGEDAQVL